MKNILFVLLLSIGVSFVSCSDGDDGGYNPDTAESPYVALPGRKVASLKTTNTVDGRNYSWEHKFVYDALGRIKEVNSEFVHHAKDVHEKFYLCNISSIASYYYNGDELRVDYSVVKIYPEDLMKNSKDSGSDRGVFNKAGVLTKFNTADFVYSGTMLKEAYYDGGIKYYVSRDASGNVTGFKKCDIDENVLSDYNSRYGYSRLPNKTNFDFSGYFGYWGVEQGISAIESPYYASYQLAAFGMFGATSAYLPLSVNNVEDSLSPGTWNLDSKGCPVSYVDPFGRKTVITYVD